MSSIRSRSRAGSAILVIAAVFSAQAADDLRVPREALSLSPNASGVAATFSTSGRIDRANPFFQSLGRNGRSCASCHAEGEGWSVTPSGIRERFRRSRGLDPIFRTVDGATWPNADVSTVLARETAYALLLRKGLFRVGLPLPENAEFELVKVDDPYGFASARELSLFRRPLPSTNLRFLSTVMWDGRETLRGDLSGNCLVGSSVCFAPLSADLSQQANDATLGHAQADVPLSAEQKRQIVAFETSLHTAQIFDWRAGSLEVHGARGGPVALSRQPAYFGINDTFAGDYRTHANFTPEVMQSYQAWHRYLPDDRRPDAEGRDREVAVARRAVARGESLFNARPIAISGVKGLNDVLRQPVVMGTCSTCHNTPGAGNHSVPLPLDLGIADASRRTPDLPLYTLRNKRTHEEIQTTDPGRALITGQWQDIGKFKGPTLRALAARPPYFHNGSAGSLDEVVQFYNQRFGIGLTPQEAEDLVAFLRAL